MTATQPPGDPLLSVVLNLSRYHREHEKFYAESPLQDAIALQRISRALKALAERWTVAEPEEHPEPSPFAGARTSTTTAPPRCSASSSWRVRASLRRSRG